MFPTDAESSSATTQEHVIGASLNSLMLQNFLMGNLPHLKTHHIVLTSFRNVHHSVWRNHVSLPYVIECWINCKMYKVLYSAQQAIQYKSPHGSEHSDSPVSTMPWRLHCGLVLPWLVCRKARGYPKLDVFVFTRRPTTNYNIYWLSIQFHLRRFGRAFGQLIVD